MLTEHDTLLTINSQMSRSAGHVVLEKSSVAITPLFLLSSYNVNNIYNFSASRLIEQASHLFNIRIGLVARICRSHSSFEKTRTDKAVVQFPDSESAIVLLLLVGVVGGRRWLEVAGEL